MSLLSTVANRAVLLNIEIVKILYSKPFSGSPYCLENKLKTVKMVCMALPLVSSPLFPSMCVSPQLHWPPRWPGDYPALSQKLCTCGSFAWDALQGYIHASLPHLHQVCSHGTSSMRPPLFKFAISPTPPCHGPSPAAAFCVLSWHLSFQYINSSLFWSVFSTPRKNKNSVKTRNF